jgi:hypothetical protein
MKIRYMPVDLFDRTVEALKSALVEISAMEDTYDDYVSTGDLLEQLEETIRELEELL